MINKKTKSYESGDGSKSPQRGNDPSNSAEDQALVNLITQTAKKSSYNNSKKDLVKTPAEAPIAKPPPKRTGCCGSVNDVAKPPVPEDEERGVLKDPQSSASYDVLGMVGEGGFSKVVLVRARAGHGANGEVYAAKIIPKAHLKSAGASFVRATMLERNILGEFDHPLLLRLYPVWNLKFYGAFVLNRRVVLHAIDATPARWREDAGSSPRAPDALVDFHTGYITRSRSGTSSCWS